MIFVLLDVKELGVRQQRVGAFLGPAAKHRDRLGAASAADTPIGLDEEQDLVLVVDPLHRVDVVDAAARDQLLGDPAWALLPCLAHEPHSRMPIPM